ncbi:MAG: hypothetical protein RBS36_04270 [Thiomicrospira sp.]|jgi:hypothetical protein|nr:hypothetical protein [Thiomicrospira sp.]
MTNNANNTSPLETKAEFARRLGVNRSTVTRGVQQGRILVNGKGLVLINESLARWEATKAGRYDVEARHAANRGHKLGLSSAAGVLGANTKISAGAARETPAGLDDISKFKAARIQYENNIMKIEGAIKSGKFLMKEDALKQILRRAAGLKAVMERLVDRLAPQIAGQTSADLIGEVIKKELLKVKE